MLWFLHFRNGHIGLALLKLTMSGYCGHGFQKIRHWWFKQIILIIGTSIYWLFMQEKLYPNQDNVVFNCILRIFFRKLCRAVYTIIFLTLLFYYGQKYQLPNSDEAWNTFLTSVDVFQYKQILTRFYERGTLYSCPIISINFSLSACLSLISLSLSIAIYPHIFVCMGRPKGGTGSLFAGVAAVCRTLILNICMGI